MTKMKRTILVIFLSISSIVFGALANSAHAADIIPVNSASDFSASSGSYRLDNNITLDTAVTLRGDLGGYTLDLNGHSLVLTSNSLLRIRGDVTIKDSSESGAGIIFSNHEDHTLQVGGSIKTGGTDEDPIYETYSGNLTIESGSIVASSDTLRAINTYGASTVTINGGNIVSLMDDTAVVTIYNNAGSKIIINGGQIESQHTALYNYGDIEMNGGTVRSAKNIAVREMTDSTFELNGGTIKTDSDSQAVTLSGPRAKLTMNGGTITATIPISEESRGGTGLTLFKEAEFTMNGGRIESTDAAVMTNGSTEESQSTSINAKLTINGGSIISDTFGLYIPHINGVTTITGGEITGGMTAIEIRAGTLNISGGVFVGGNEYDVKMNNSGTTTKGAAIAVAQHNTKQPINVNICGGTFRAAVPFSETNPQGNAPEFTETIDGHINNSCAELKFESTGDKDIVSENIEKFVSGGIFTHDVTEFVADGYGATLEAEEGYYAVYPIRRAKLVYVKNGRATLSLGETLAGESVLVDATPDDGYELAGISVADSLGDPILDSGNSYVAPDDDTFVWVVFRASQPEPQPTPTPTPTPTPIPDTEPTPAPAPDKKSEEDKSEQPSNAPRTNDSLMEYVGLFAICVVVLAIIGIRRKLAKDTTL